MPTPRRIPPLLSTLLLPGLSQLLPGVCRYDMVIVFVTPREAWSFVDAAHSHSTSALFSHVRCRRAKMRVDCTMAGSSASRASSPRTNARTSL